MPFLLILSHFRPFLLIFQVILMIIFIDFLVILLVSLQYFEIIKIRALVITNTATEGSDVQLPENTKTVILAGVVVKIIVTMVTNNNLEHAAFKLSRLSNHEHSSDVTIASMHTYPVLLLERVVRYALFYYG